MNQPILGRLDSVDILGDGRRCSLPEKWWELLTSVCDDRAGEGDYALCIYT